MAESRSPELQQLYDDAAVQFPAWAWAVTVLMTAFSIAYAVIQTWVSQPPAVRRVQQPMDGQVL